MDTRPLIPLLLLAGMVCFSYHSLTAAPSPWLPQDGRRDWPVDQQTELSWVVDQFRMIPLASACHLAQTHNRSATHIQRPAPAQQSRNGVSGQDTKHFLLETINATPFRRAERAHPVHTCVNPLVPPHLGMVTRSHRQT